MLDCMNDIADRIKEIRKQLKLSQAKLGMHAGGVSKSAVHQWEMGVTKPAWEALSALHKSLRLNPDWIMRGEGSMFEGQSQSPTTDLMAPGSDGLPFEGIGLTPKQRALLGAFERLTASQQEEFMRELEVVKRKNEQIIEELTIKSGNSGKNS
ncbi:helix-turn-helix domain-containing protein [Acidithiobacillus sp. CV18-2]|nr:helix-turn-helix domain-containing protein [Acidithiobacillus sp. CV18-3]MBU2757169.1 helix-turn-helix domain-containing protein [Acidithiobacillus sp. BN09-2]MBU2776376.1 helix-turn-helix domain-containing protein [Acidithiobacillus sp. CV18-2]MBU2798982.1 helix-turn-helix domain-containing protein [Acidithiobacillus sp. VAN18-4]